MDRQILDMDRTRGGGARLLGGRAVHYLCADHIPKSLFRNSQDIDFYVPERKRRILVEVLEQSGWQGDREFNLLNGKTRLIFKQDGEKVDVFVDVFKMSHVVPLGSYDHNPYTLSSTDLLLIKLQVFEITAKDLIDSCALLCTFSLDNQGIRADYIARLLAGEWGLWRTFTNNLERLATSAREIMADDLTAAELVQSRARDLLAYIEREPKRTSWRIRNMVGERVPWYEKPEEP